MADFETLLVEDAEMQVETPDHFDEPLVNQVLRDHDQDASGAMCEQLLVHDQTGLDGLAKADFVGQKHPRCMAFADLVGNVELVRYQAGTGARESNHRRALAFGQGLQGPVPHFEPAWRVDLLGQQPVQQIR